MHEELKSLIRDLGGQDYIADIPDDFLTAAKLRNLADALVAERDGRVHLDSLPFHYIIEPTNHCNLACALCPTGQEGNEVRKGRMTLDTFRALTDKIADSCGALFLQNWGEATLIKDLPAMIEYAASRRIWTVLSSNFSIPYPDGFLERLINSGLGRLQIDIDGVTQESYAAYRRNGRLDLVLDNARKAVAIKRAHKGRGPILQANMILMRQNEHEQAAYRALCAELGMDEATVSRVQINPALGRDWLPQDPSLQYGNYADSAPAAATSCQRLYTTLVINWSRSVDACCLVYDPQAAFGRLQDQPLHDLWNNDHFRSARAVFHAPGTETVRTICADCRNCLGNKALKRYKNSFALTL